MAGMLASLFIGRCFNLFLALIFLLFCGFCVHLLHHIHELHQCLRNCELRHSDIDVISFPKGHMIIIWN